MSWSAAWRVFERDLVFLRRIWVSVLLGSIVQPVMYLLGVGVGVGTLVDRGADSATTLGGLSYLAFYATALLATTPMFIAGQEALWPTLDGFKWNNAYRAMIATPVNPADVVVGQLLRFATRAFITVSGVAVVLSFFDDTRSWGLIAAIPFGVLTGLAFAMPFAAWTGSREGEASFPAIIRFGIVPMFLFAGAFYPIEQLPEVLRPIAWVTPLWHGVELCRGVVTGGLAVGRALIHVAVLLAYVAAGTAASMVTFDRALRS